MAAVIPDLRNVDDILFDMFKTDDDKVSVARFLSALKDAGLGKNDPRLATTMRQLQNLQKSFRRRATSSNILESSRMTTQKAAALQEDSASTTKLLIDRETFKKCIADGLVLITKALRGQLAVPDWAGFKDKIGDIYNRVKTNNGGRVADYIPQLARYSPELWGLSVCTIDGQRAHWGDSAVPFSIQSASKPLNYGIALHDLGAQFVHQHVGQEPSGRLFNEICLDSNNRPHNPLINAGAIVTANLIKKEWSWADRFEYMIKMYKKFAGGDHVEFSNSTFLSERETADRNYALAYYMREHKALPRNASVQDMLEFYFQLCSVEVTCESAAVIAATLAFGGICPITGDRVLNSDSIRHVLSLMYSCGLYDWSGQFAFRVGLPAKSGVSGILMVVVPNVMGFAMWSPALDKLGNSVRGVHFCTELVELFNFHNYDSLLHSDTKIDPRRKDVAAVNDDKVVYILSASAAGDLDSLKRYYVQGISMDSCDYDGRTALHLAASEGYADVIQFLVERCAVELHPKDRWNRTPMDDARDNGHGECLSLLKEYAEMPELKKKSAEQLVKSILPAAYHAAVQQLKEEKVDKDKVESQLPVVEAEQPKFKQLPPPTTKPVLFSAEPYSDEDSPEEKSEKSDVNGNVTNGLLNNNLPAPEAIVKRKSSIKYRI